MSKQRLYALKGVIFGLGVILYAVCFAIFTKGAPVNGSENLTTHNAQFVWSTVAIVYIALFLPLLFNEVTFKNIAAQPVAFAFLWIIDIIFCVASLVMSIFVYYRKMETATALIVEGVIVFLALLTVLISLIKGEDNKTIGEVQESVKESIKDAKTNAKDTLKTSLQNKGAKKDF